MGSLVRFFVLVVVLSVDVPSVVGSSVLLLNLAGVPVLVGRSHFLMGGWQPNVVVAL